MLTEKANALRKCTYFKTDKGMDANVDYTRKRNDESKLFL